MTTPSRDGETCKNMAIRLDSPTTHSRPYLNCAPACQVGSPIARIHVADAHEQCRPDERSILLPKSSVGPGDRDRAVQPFERAMAACRQPCASIGIVWVFADHCREQQDQAVTGTSWTAACPSPAVSCILYIVILILITQKIAGRVFFCDLCCNSCEEMVCAASVAATQPAEIRSHRLGRRRSLYGLQPRRRGKRLSASPSDSVTRR